MGPCKRVGNARRIGDTRPGNAAANEMRSGHALGRSRSRFGTKFGSNFDDFEVAKSMQHLSLLSLSFLMVFR